jgi:uncharacterized protein YukE
MYGDSGTIRAHARRMHERAEEIRAEAAALGSLVAGVGWTGVAADAMRQVTGQHVAGLRRCADIHDRAADALERHARQVDHVTDLIARIERHVLGVLDSAASGVAGLVAHVVPDPVDRWARDFEPLPHGSLAWLDVDVPGAA